MLWRPLRFLAWLASLLLAASQDDHGILNYLHEIRPEAAAYIATGTHEDKLNEHYILSGMLHKMFQVRSKTKEIDIAHYGVARAAIDLLARRSLGLNVSHMLPGFTELNPSQFRNTIVEDVAVFGLYMKDTGQWLDFDAGQLRHLANVFPHTDYFVLTFFYLALGTLINLGGFNGGRKSYLEGYCSFQQARWLQRAASSPSVRQACEIGFNAGHSAAAVLLAQPDLNLASFDLFERPYSRFAEGFMKQIFPDRLSTTVGFSNSTVPSQRGLRCDLWFIDGGHSYEEARTDLVNSRRCASRHALIVMDDVRCAASSTALPEMCIGSSRAWQEAISSAVVEELGCSCHESAKSMAFGGGKFRQCGWCWGVWLQ